MLPYLTTHDPAKARTYYDQGLWQGDTFYDLLCQHTAARPDAPALRDGRSTLSWCTVKARVDAFADDLHEQGIGAGDRISVWMSNRVECVIAFLGATREGVAVNPSLHKSHTCKEVLELLGELQSRAIITEDNWGADRKTNDFYAMLDSLPFVQKVYKPDAFPCHITNADPEIVSNPDVVSYLAFTSGTTGKPKCVMHSANTLLANARDLARDWQLDTSSVILSLSPFSHHIAWVAFSQWLVCGGQLVMNDLPADTTTLDWLLETGATYVLGVPTHAMDILDEQRSRNLPDLGSVKTFYMAGSPIPEVVAQAFVKQGIAPQNVYGMTECSSHQYTHPDDPMDVWTTTCGRGGPAYKVKIWNPEYPDEEMPQGLAGEIGGRGACQMLGYFDNQSATEKTFNKHGYLLSGDLGFFDSQGNLHIQGRAKDLIIRGGHNIYPADIEAVAVKHEQVAKAAAFGIADDRLGEKVCLAVIGQVNAEDMLGFLNSEGLSKYDMPEWFIALDAMPLTASGKILKRELQAMVARGDISPEAVRFKA